MPEINIKELLTKHQQGTLSPQEQELLENWYLQWNVTPETISEERLTDISQHIFSRLPQPGKTRRLWPRIAAAASIVFLLGFGSYFYFKPETVKQQVAHDIAPGKNTATLTLANGQKIILANTTNGQIAQQNGVRITKTANGQVVYTLADNTNSAADQYNTLSTAKGETYKVNLPDGTQVWLNAASSLTYPARFNAADRKVTLTGEAYFEVAKDKAHPFKVKTAEQEVTVLGTHFNINAYTDESATQTTLLEGSVKIIAGSSEQLIKPGQQASFDRQHINVKAIDTDLAIGWKNDEFIFDDENISYIMRMIARWYNVEVIYTGPASTEKFYGTVSRYKNVSEVLKTLESTNKIHFQIKGRKIIVNN